MPRGSKITHIKARQVFTERGHPGIETTIKTEDGSKGVAVVTAGISVGEHEVQFLYDGGEKWNGMGLNVAIETVEKVITPKLKGMDVTRQQVIDDALITLDGTPNKAKLGGNTTASVSAAVLKAGSNYLDIPLYQHIGGVNANILPVPGVLTALGSKRYKGTGTQGGKPSYSIMCYGFNSFADASYAAWEVSREWSKLILKKLRLETTYGYVKVHEGVVEHDKELWDIMVEAIDNKGYTGKMGIQVDIAAGTYYNKEKDRFVGLFSEKDKTMEDLLNLYDEMVKDYPFVIIEDPLDENDYQGHAEVTKRLGVEIVGDDLFTTNPQRVQEGIEAGAGNAVLLKVNQIGTISEAFEMVNLAYRNDYGVMPCDSRGEGVSIADYTVGLGAGHLREGAMKEIGNRFLEIEEELGNRAKFLGRKGFKP